MQLRWRIVLYESASGRSPVAEFIRQQPVKDQVLIDNKIRMLATIGPTLGMPHAKNLDKEGLWELRGRGTRGNYRMLYCFFASEKTFVLVHGILKQRGPVPHNDLDTARRRMWEYRARRE